MVIQYITLYIKCFLVLGVTVVRAKFKCTKCHKEIAYTEPYFHFLVGINHLISI